MFQSAEQIICRIRQSRCSNRRNVLSILRCQHSNPHIVTMMHNTISLYRIRQLRRSNSRIISLHIDAYHDVTLCRNTHYYSAVEDTPIGGSFYHFHPPITTLQSTASPLKILTYSANFNILIGGPCLFLLAQQPTHHRDHFLSNNLSTPPPPHFF